MPETSESESRSVLSRSLCVISGDGIGPEVTRCALLVLAAVEDRVAGPRLYVEEHPGGAETYQSLGTSLPEATITAAQRSDGVLVGAFDVARLPPGATQPLRALRSALGACASLRRAVRLGAVDHARDIDVLVVRELTQGLYSGVEYQVDMHSACAVRIITREATVRAARLAFQEARRRHGKVTVVHKIGALKLSDGVFLKAVEEVADDFPGVRLESKNVDACALELVRHPDQFDVVFASNAFGDILSDVAAAVADGLGTMPSACIGEAHAYFEPVHGSAPDIAGQGVANPIAAILSAAWLLRHLDVPQYADPIERAVRTVVRAGQTLTADLGGDAGTAEVTDTVIASLADQ